jgi:hypothetical protein
VQHYTSGSIDGTDASGLPTSAFTVQDFAATISGAWRFNRLDLGVSSKWVHSTIATSASAISFDGGATLRLARGWRVSAAARNVGGTLTYDAVGSKLPLQIELGAARTWNRWTAESDLNFPVDNAPYLSAGLEYRAPLADHWTGAGRAGFNTRSYSDGNGVRNVAIGLGLAYSSDTGEVLSLDYAFAPIGQLGSEHRITLGMRFGLPELVETTRPAPRWEPGPDPTPGFEQKGDQKVEQKELKPWTPPKPRSYLKGVEPELDAVPQTSTPTETNTSTGTTKDWVYTLPPEAPVSTATVVVPPPAAPAPTPAPAPAPASSVEPSSSTAPSPAPAPASVQTSTSTKPSQPADTINLIPLPE